MSKEWSVKEAFATIKGRVIKVNRNVMRETSESIHDLLSLPITDYSDGEFKPKNRSGITPFDLYRKNKSKSSKARNRLIDSWKRYERKDKKNEITFRFINTGRHAKYLFGKEMPNEKGAPHFRSAENRNFRSSQNHARQMYENNPKLYKRYEKEPDRPNQLTKKKWNSFLIWGKKELLTNLKGKIKNIDKYKGL